MREREEEGGREKERDRVCEREREGGRECVCVSGDDSVGVTVGNGGTVKG